MTARAFRSLVLSLSLLPLVGCPKPDDHVVIAPEQSPAKDPELVDFSSSLSKATLEADQPQELFARFRVSGKEFPGAGRPTVNLALALDASGSMEGEAIEDAKAAATKMLDRLQDGDRLAIVSFGGKTELLFASQTLNPATRESARQAIESMQAKGTTDMLGGMTQALGEVQRSFVGDGVNRIVLLSDGVPNVVDGIDNLAAQAQASKISITALGLGLEFDETLLARISSQSGGRYHYLESSDQALAVFDEELLHMQRSVARGMSLSLRAGPGVQIVEVVGHPGAAQGTSAALSLGDLADDETREIVVRLSVPGHQAGTHAELLDAFLNFEDVVVGAQYLSREDYVSASVGGEPDDAAIAVAREVEAAAHRAMAAAAIVEVAAMVRNGQLAEGMSRLTSAKSAAETAAKEFDDDALSELVAEMQALADSWPTQPPAIAIDATGGGSPAPVDAPDRPEAGDAAMEPVPAAPPSARSMRRSHAKAVEALR